MTKHLGLGALLGSLLGILEVSLLGLPYIFFPYPILAAACGAVAGFAIGETAKIIHEKLLAGKIPQTRVLSFVVASLCGLLVLLLHLIDKPDPQEKDLLLNWFRLLMALGFPSIGLGILIGRRLFLKEEMDQLLAVLQEAPRHAESLVQLGIYKTQYGEYSGALETFRKARECSPSPDDSEKIATWSTVANKRKGL